MTLEALHVSLIITSFLLPRGTHYHDFYDHYFFVFFTFSYMYAYLSNIV